MKCSHVCYLSIAIPCIIIIYSVKTLNTNDIILNTNIPYYNLSKYLQSLVEGATTENGIETHNYILQGYYTYNIFTV